MNNKKNRRKTFWKKENKKKLKMIFKSLYVYLFISSNNNLHLVVLRK